VILLTQGENRHLEACQIACLNLHMGALQNRKKKEWFLGEGNIKQIRGHKKKELREEP